MKLTTQIQKCKKCPELVNRIKPVIGEGPIPCKIVFLGEAPGKNEDETGLPFVGRSGDILEAAAFSAGLTRGKDYHILNVLKCRPPENRNPSSEELKNCAPFLSQQLQVVQPKVIVALGRYAQAYLLNKNPTEISILKTMGNIVKHPLWPYQVILSCHPSYISHNRNPEILEAFKTHIKKAVELADKERKNGK
jgi:DNA polymerase